MTRLIPLDQQFLDALHVQNIPELKEKSSRICKEIHQLRDHASEKDMSPQVREIILAKASCFSALCDALQFKEPDFQKLNNARETFEKLKFDASIVGVNSLDTIIRILSKYTCLEDIPDPIQHSIVRELDNLTALDGALTGRIPIEKKYSAPKSTTKTEEPEVIYHFISNTEKDRVRLCLVQLNFSVEYTHSGEFGYTLKEKEITKKKVFEALDIAVATNTDIICFPELSTAEEWVQKAKEYKDLTIVFGTYYKNEFNTCPILVKGQDSYIQKINPSPQFETEVIQNKKMKKGKKIFVFQTKYGSFVVLICMDYLEEAHCILYSRDEKIKNVDFIIVPAYNKDVMRFQKKGDTDCQEGNYPYIVQVNSLSIQGARGGGTCVIGTEHKDALARYKDLGLRLKDAVQYKLIETYEESIVIIDLDIKRKGAPIPASGPKMKVLQKYIYENGKWNLVDF